MKSFLHPAHGLLTSNAFLNHQLQLQNGTKVKFTYKPSRPIVEDTGDVTGFDYTLTRVDDGHSISVMGLDLFWKPRHGPGLVDWKSLDLRIYPTVNNLIGLQRKIEFDLCGIEKVSALKVKTPRLWTFLTSGSKDGGFFSHTSPVIREFKRRLTIENAAERVSDAKKTLEKHLTIPPFVTD